MQKMVDALESFGSTRINDGRSDARSEATKDDQNRDGGIEVFISKHEVLMLHRVMGNTDHSSKTATQRQGKRGKLKT